MGTGAIVLMVFPYRSWPVQGGGGARLWSMIAALRGEGFRVALLTPEGRGQARGADLPEVDFRFTLGARGVLQPDVAFFPADWRSLRFRIGSWVRRAVHQVNRTLGVHFVEGESAFRSLLPGNASDSRQAALAGAVRSACVALGPVAAITHLTSTAHLLDSVPRGVFRILDTIDVQHLRTGSAPIGLPPLWTRETETRELLRADAVIAIQDGEAEILRAMVPERKVITVGHVTQMPARDALATESVEVLFVGNDYAPNNEALLAFLCEHWPVIRVAVPAAVFRVCGRVGNTLPPELPAGVVKAGYVEDMHAAYAGAAVVINPVERGTGLKIKTVEALTHGKCVVGVPHSMHGLPVEPGAPPVCVVPRERLAATVIELLQDKEARRRWEQRARAYAGRHLSASAVYRPLVDLLRQAPVARAATARLGD